MRRILVMAIAALLATTAACAAEIPDFGADSTGGSSTENPGSALPIVPSTTTTTTTTEPPLVVPEQLAGLEIQPITVIDDDIRWILTVAVADSQEDRGRGLMDVADLGDLDGMLFVWEEPLSTGFWMDDVILPLDIAFFGDDLMYVDHFTMPLCTADPCPTHSAGGPFQYALELLESSFIELTSSAKLNLDP